MELWLQLLKSWTKSIADAQLDLQAITMLKIVLGFFLFFLIKDRQKRFASMLVEKILALKKFQAC